MKVVGEKPYSVPPMSASIVEAQIFDELGRMPSALFARFERRPLAAGSFGQVHAATLPDGKSGPISRFSGIKLGADETISLNCSEVHRLLPEEHGFLDGFAVIESDVEQDVVAVYTAAGEDDKVRVLSTERVPARKMQ